MTALVYKNPQPVEILLVEDNAGDVELTQEAFKDGKIANRLHIARNGDEALDFLYRRGPYANVVRPDMVFLDLNMPGTHGKEVLKIIKEDETLKEIPVIILTSSEAKTDIAQSYELHANAYLVKPIGWQQFMQVAKAVEMFWLTLVKLPPPKKEN